MSIAEKLQTIAENEQKVYNAGVQAEYDRFWDEFQKDPYNRIGNRYDYVQAFKGHSWTDKIYNPKWDFGEQKTVEVDGVQKQVRRVKYAAEMFLQSMITDTLKPMDFTEIYSGTNGLFAYTTKLKTIRTLTVVEGTTFNNWFQNATAIENITFDGVIGQDINFQWSTKLTKDSITSIIEHLSNTASGKTLTLSKTAVNTAFNMTDGNPSTEWSNLVGTKQNWTISLV
jgi:hypothetical protein